MKKRWLWLGLVAVLGLLLAAARAGWWWLGQFCQPVAVLSEQVKVEPCSQSQA